MRILSPRPFVCAFVGLLAVQTVRAQNPYDPWQDRYGRDGRYDAYTRLARVEAGTFVTVRTREPIDANQRQGRMFPAVVESDVWDQYSRLAVPAIPRGSPAELRVRTAPDGDLILDLDSIVVDGRRYAVASTANRIQGRDPQRKERAAEYVGGGALLGTIIGAIAGGGKGAAIGAGAGAGAGAVGLLTRGREVHVPAGSQLTFRLERELSLGQQRAYRSTRR